MDPTGVRVYKVLLRLYPRAFRLRFGAELIAAVRDELAGTPRSGRYEQLRFWARLGLDLTASASRLHVQQTLDDLRRTQAELLALSRFALRPAAAVGRGPRFPSLIGGLLMSSSYTRPTANDRFKHSFSTTLWSSVIIATVAHFALLNFFPELEAEIMTTEEVAPPEVVIPRTPLPEPPVPIRPPAKPIVSKGMEPFDVTIGETTFNTWEPPVYTPPAVTDPSTKTGPSFTPYELAPTIKNRPELTRALSGEYPTILRDAGIGGTVVVWLYIDEQGQVQRFQVQSPSPHEALNQAALRVVGVAEFSPAMNRDRAVSVWVQFPVTFQVR